MTVDNLNQDALDMFDYIASSRPCYRNHHTFGGYSAEDFQLTERFQTNSRTYLEMLLHHLKVCGLVRCLSSHIVPPSYYPTDYGLDIYVKSNPTAVVMPIEDLMRIR